MNQIKKNSINLYTLNSMIFLKKILKLKIRI